MIREWLLRVVLLIASTAIALLLGEGLARVALSDITTVFDTRYYPSVRWFERNPISYNSWGFRERELRGLPRGDAYRIAVVGDGFTHSQGIDDADLLTRVLERRLNEAGGLSPDGTRRTYEVLAFARSGDQTDDQIEYLRTHVLETRPDFVLLQWFINDAENDRQWRPPELDVPLVWRLENLLGVDLRRWFQQRSALYYITAHWLGSVGTRRGWLETYEEHMTARLTDPDGKDARDMEDSLLRFVEIARDNDLPVGIFAFPLITAVGGEPQSYPLGFLIDRVMTYCERESLDCVDLRSALAAAGPASGLWINRLDGHPGPAANDAVAAALMDAYAPQWGAGR
jgi:lysophospholipase L1-like esterase